MEEIQFENIDFAKLDISGLLNLCLKCQTKEDAKKLLEHYEKYCDNPETAHINLGYIFGYASEENRKRLYSLFPLIHPIFGPSFGRGSDGIIMKLLTEWIKDHSKK